MSRHLMAKFRRAAAGTTRMAAIDEHKGRGIDDLSQEPPEPLWRPGDQVVFGPTGRGTKPVYKLLTVKDVKHATDRRDPEEWWEPGESGWSYSFEHGYQGRLREHYLNSAHTWDGPEATVPKRRPKKAPAVEMMGEDMGEPCPDCDGNGVKFTFDDEDEDNDEIAVPCPTCGGHGDLDSAWQAGDAPGRGQQWLQWQRGEGRHPDCKGPHRPIRDTPKPVPGRPHTRDATSEAHPAWEDFTNVPTSSFSDYYDWMHDHTQFYDWPQFSHESVDSFMKHAPKYLTEATGDYWIHDWIDEQEAKGWPAWKGDDHRLIGEGHQVPPEADPRHNRNLLSRLAQWGEN